MKVTLSALFVLILSTSCSTLHSLNDRNCTLPKDANKNFVGKWKVSTSDRKFIWRFYSDNSTATLANQYLTQIFGKPVFLSQWQNDKIDTLRVYYDFSEIADRTAARSQTKTTADPNRIEFYISDKECRRIILVNTRTADTLTLKRRQYFYQ